MYIRCMNEKEKLEWEGEKKIIQFLLSCATSILHARSSRALARRAPFSFPSRENLPSLVNAYLRSSTKKASSPDNHTRTHLSYMSIIASVALGNRLWGLAPWILPAIGKRKRKIRTKVSRHARINRTTRAARRTTRTYCERQQPDRIVPRLRQQCPRVGGLSAADAVGNPDCGPPPVDHSPPPSLFRWHIQHRFPRSGTRRRAPSRRCVWGARTAFPASGKSRRRLTFSFRREINGESTMDGSKFYIGDHFLSFVDPSNFGKIMF